MKLEIPIIVGFDNMESLLDDLKKLQRYKLFEGDEMVLVDIKDVAKVLMDHVKAKESVKDDMISRADAIDALDDIESEVADGFGFQYEKWRKHFADLPSAQPELPKLAQRVEQMYNKALKMPYIQKPLAWALYQVWREYDAERRIDE